MGVSLSVLYLLDTNILIDWFAKGPGQDFVAEKIIESSTRLATAWICAAEFLVKARVKEEKALSAIFKSGDLQLLELSGVASLNLVAEVQRKTKLPLPDAIVLATAQHHQATLVTQDRLLLRRSKNCAAKVLSPV